LADHSKREKIRQRAGNLFDRNGKARAFALIGRVNRRVDADEFPPDVDERTTAVAGIDVRIGLQPVLESPADVCRHPAGDSLNSNSPGHRTAQAKRIPHRNDGFAQQQIIVFGNLDGTKRFVAGAPHDSQQGQIFSGWSRAVSRLRTRAHPKAAPAPDWLVATTCTFVRM
jgi:hypothetical protein